MWHLHQTQGKQTLNCGQCSSTPPVSIQVGVLQQPTTGAGSPGTKDQCGVGQGAGGQTRVQRLRIGRALGCWESGVESDPALGEKDARLKSGGGSICKPQRDRRKGQPATGLAPRDGKEPGRERRGCPLNKRSHSPSNSSLSSRRASFLSRRSCRSISALMR